MTLSFNIEYRTSWGEEVKVCGNVPELGNGYETQAKTLSTIDGIHWYAEVEVTNNMPQEIEYFYLITKESKVIRKEWNKVPRVIYESNCKQRLILKDCWKDMPADASFFSSAFTQALMAPAEKDVPPAMLSRSILFKANCPRLEKGCCLAISGNQTALGNWGEEGVLCMSNTNFPEWQVCINAEEITFPLEYKFVIYNKLENRIEYWEHNSNRYLSEPHLKVGESLVVADRNVCIDRPLWKGAGMAVPVFSLRSAESFGIGDFGDLKLLVDWAVCTQQKVIQILPINDTTMTHTWSDSYPYNSISIYALHPMYINLQALGDLKDKKIEQAFQSKQIELNDLDYVDYEAVSQAKWNYLELIYKQEGARVLKSEGFKKFFDMNKEWLMPYAAFCLLRDRYHTANFRNWPKYQEYRQSEIEALCSTKSADFYHLGFFYYIQYNLHIQLLDATAYARQNGVILKGDIPIGISRCSVEAWTEPHLFNLNGQAGAPPDDFSIKGQNWGFPTYNWDVMERDGYKWWMKRFTKMAEYFDAYRIDHILGFFRIWEIPTDAVEGLLGQFTPALPLTKDEIEQYGLTFKEEYLTPYIHEYFLPEIFGKYTEKVKEKFLVINEKWEIYKLKDEFNTQRKVEEYFKGQTDTESMTIKMGLFKLIGNVLFVKDKNNCDKYHPRIAVQQEYVFQALNDWEKASFNRLYNDFFYHRHNQFWKDQAMKKLPSLTQATKMLVCGEDLGMIPACVPEVMNKLGILSLEVERMPKKEYQEFGDIWNYPYNSICTFSTHDMSTLRGWWNEDSQKRQRYYNEVLGYYGTAPEDATADICHEIVKRQLNSQSILCILSLQDWLSIDEEIRCETIEKERINVPSNPKHQWKYRMHLKIEELLAAESLNSHIRELLLQTGRRS